MSKALTRNAHVLGAVATLLLVAAIGLMTWFEFSNSRSARQWVGHTYAVVRTVDALGSALRDAETGQRGYLLTGRDDYLAPYDAARDRIALLQGDLTRLTADNPAQQDRLRGLAPLVRQKMDELAASIQARRDSGLEAALAIVRTDEGERLMGAIRATLAELVRAEDALLAERQRAADIAETWARGLALGGALLAVGLLALATRLLAVARGRQLQSEAGQRALAFQMQSAFDSISQGIGVFGPDGRLARWNECFLVLLGIPRTWPGVPYATVAAQAEAAAGGPFLETGDELRGGRRDRLPGEPVVYERTRASDDRSFEIRRTATPDRGFVLTLTDVTERVRAEKTRHDAQRLQATGQLTGGIAHDFNNLLTIIMGNLERLGRKLGTPRLADPAKPAELQRMIEHAMHASRRGAALTQHLLAFARRQPLAPQPINLSVVMPDMVNLLRRALGEHIDIRVVEGAGLWPAMADPAQVETAVLNLALNARDAMPQGGSLTIEVANKVLDTDYARQHAEVTAGDYSMIGVSDTGTGMPPQILVRAFDPFFTTKAAGKGTGLGLAMVYGFAKQSGGHVKIYSEVGMGTTVRLYLPRASGAALPAQQRATAPADLPRGTATILVVEDEPGVRAVAAAILADLGYRVLEANDGPEAMRAFGACDGKIDLVLADVVLSGGMKGNEVVARLREIKPGLKALFMSGYTENAIVHHGRLDDGVALIGKPFTSEEMARKVADILGVAAAPEIGEADNVVGFPPKH